MSLVDGLVRLPGIRTGLRYSSLALLTLLTLLLLSGAPSLAQDAPQGHAPEPARADAHEGVGTAEGPTEVKQQAGTEKPEQQQAGKPEQQQAGKPEQQQAGKPEQQQAGTEKPEQEATKKSKPEILLPRPGSVENITVYNSGVAQQHLQEAVSMTTFNPEELKSLHIQNIQDLADYTPSLEINTRTAASNPTLFIRGIGLKDYNANAAGDVAIYQDGINISSPAIQLLQLFDTENVDVRRGPQGGEGGRGATAGAIYIKSNLPTDEFEASASTSYGNYSALDVEGHVNVPIVEDKLAARVAFTLSQRAGTTRNGCAGWNPRAHPQFQDVPASQATGTQGKAISYVLSPAALRAEYYKDKSVNNPITNPSNYTIKSTQQPNRQRLLNDGGTGLQAVELLQDNVCMTNPNGPGSIVTANGQAAGLGPEGSYLPYFGIPQLSDFQGLNRYVNDKDQWAGRGILRWNPSDDMEWILNVHNFHTDGGASHLSMIGAKPKAEQLGFDGALAGDQFSEENAANLLGLEGTQNAPGVDAAGPGLAGRRGDNPFIGYYNRDGRELLSEYGGSLKGTWELGSNTITSLTGYETYRRKLEDEGDASPLDLFPSIYHDSSYELSQELYTNGASGPWTWKVGGFVLYEYLVANNFYPAINQLIVDQVFSQSLLSLAPYVSGRYDLTDEIGIESGFRLNVEKKVFTLSATSIGTTSNLTNKDIEQQSVQHTWVQPTGELKLTYAPDWGWLDGAGVDDLNFYLKGTRGFKGGHFNGAQSTQADVTKKTQVVSTAPEYIWAVEGGIKSRLFDDRATITGAAYRYWYTGLQVFDIRNEYQEIPTQQLLNGDALVWGAELEVDTRPFDFPVLDGLHVKAGYSFIDSAFTNFKVTKTVRPGPRHGAGTQETFDYAGHPLIAAPRHSFYGIFEWEFPLFGYGTLTPEWDLNYRTKTYLDPQMLDPISQPAYWVHNASVTYRTEEGHVEVQGWVQNALNVFYKDDAFDLTRTYKTILESYNDPRTFGVTVTLTW